MFKIDSRLVFFISVLALLIAVLSCSQKDNVAALKSITKVWLSTERLPSAAPGMVYELWATKVAPEDLTSPSDAASLGRFSYISSDTLVAFTDGNGTVRSDSNLFSLEGDLFDYAYLVVAVQVAASADDMPGPILLMNPIAGNSDTLRLYFPKHDSLFESTIRCNFETPTDGNSGNDRSGLWFSNYERVAAIIEDTNGVDISYIDSTIEPIYDADSNILNLATLYGSYPDSFWVTFDTVLLDFGRDTLALGVTQTDEVLTTGHLHHGAKSHILYKVDSTQIPRTVKSFHIVWNIVRHTVYLDVFSQDLYGLPDLSMYGWKYQGWVISNSIPAEALGEFTPPAWDFTSGELLFPGYLGGLISTGKFVDVTSADESNPYTLPIDWEVDSIRIDTTIEADTLVIDTSYARYSVLKRPNLPGEDFLDGDSLFAYTGGVIAAPLNFFPLNDMSDSATIFVSIEPDNKVWDSTNFPLIAFSREFPPVGPNYNGPYYWTLINWTGTSSGANGFPKMTAEIQRL